MISVTLVSSRACVLSEYERSEEKRSLIICISVICRCKRVSRMISIFCSCSISGCNVCDKRFANVHPNEKARRDFLLFRSLSNGNHPRFDQLEDNQRRESVNVYWCTYGWNRSSGLHHLWSIDSRLSSFCHRRENKHWFSIVVAVSWNWQSFFCCSSGSIMLRLHWSWSSQFSPRQAMLNKGYVRLICRAFSYVHIYRNSWCNHSEPLLPSINIQPLWRSSSGIFSRAIAHTVRAARLSLCIYDVRVNWATMVVIEWLVSSLSILIILSFSITDRKRTTGEQMPLCDEQQSKYCSERWKWMNGWMI